MSSGALEGAARKGWIPNGATSGGLECSHFNPQGLKRTSVQLQGRAGDQRERMGEGSECSVVSIETVSRPLPSRTVTLSRYRSSHPFPPCSVSLGQVRELSDLSRKGGSERTDGTS